MIKGFKWNGWLKPIDSKPSGHRVYSFENKPFNTDENGNIYCHHKQEIEDLRQAYWKKYPANGDACFLVGSSLVGNKEGDSARFWKLTRDCERECNG